MSVKKSPSTVPVPQVEENYIMGTLYSLGAVAAGIVLWVTFWRLGFIASIAAFAIAWLAIKLYGFGAGVVTRKSVPIIFTVTIVGAVLAFLAGIASDIMDAVVKETGVSYMSLINNSRFWSAFGHMLFNSQILSAYRGDALMSLIFVFLGIFFTLKNLFVITGENYKKSEVIASKPTHKPAIKKNMFGLTRGKISTKKKIVFVSIIAALFFAHFAISEYSTFSAKRDRLNNLAEQSDKLSRAYETCVGHEDDIIQNSSNGVASGRGSNNFGEVCKTLLKEQKSVQKEYDRLLER